MVSRQVGLCLISLIVDIFFRKLKVPKISVCVHLLYLKLEVHTDITGFLKFFWFWWIWEWLEGKKASFSSLSFVSVNLTRVLCYLFKKTKWCYLVLLMEACVHTGMDVERFAWMSEWEIKAETSVTGSMVLIIYIRWGHSLIANYLHQSYKLTGHFIRHTLMKWLILI